MSQTANDPTGSCCGPRSVTSLQLGSQRRPGGYRQPCPHDAIGAKHPDAEVGDVHGAAFAMAVAGTPAKELSHHQFDVCTLGDGVSVTTMGADDFVVSA